jgi:hypothetical protein
MFGAPERMKACGANTFSRTIMNQNYGGIDVQYQIIDMR